MYQKFENMKKIDGEAKREAASLQCNKGKAFRFKRSFYGIEEDASLSAMLILACIVCSPLSTRT